MANLQAGEHGLAAQVPSPNCDRRPPGSEVSLVVIHGISVPPGKFGGDGIARLFTNTSDLPSLRELRVSCHFLVDRHGALTQFVNCDMRAWHAGKSCWNGKDKCNDFSVGIELEGTDSMPYASCQYTATAALVADLRAAYPQLAHVTGHCHISPGRKTDPGPAFDWDRFLDLVGKGMDGRKMGGH